MNSFSNLKQFFTTPSKIRTYIFIGMGVFLTILIIVVICVASSGSDTTNLTPFESYIEAKKFLYVWTYPNAENLIKFLVDHNYSKIFLYVGCIQWDYDSLIKGEFYNAGNIDAKELIQKLLAKNIEVELCIYLNDSPNNFNNVDKVPGVAQALAEVQKTLKFTALHFDVEPQNNENLEALLKMYEDSRKYIKVSAILKPAWLSKTMSSLASYFSSADYYKKFKDCETYVDAIMTVTDYSDVMAYSNKYEIVDTFLEKYDTIRKRHNSHIARPVLELDPKANDDSTYYRYEEDQKTFFNYFVSVSKRFDGATIHQYTAWYKDLYCDEVKKDSSYYFGGPKKC